ncbi:MAG: Phenylalanine-tRNA ligase beta subunit [Candidatus Moranbacteria bacterium GW2011_GWF2_34_56]|nr:MAG: Phenylalanine-tRNA ligase beta subunit [Candidatus Moranbacteria bacterium GW2011_GWF1_34_10]KKP65063.1 MAG: Phenylalanine-tRNA ligase beta subunit [Candidatus Moranbacteria bacterium GW2011_GWF2_34_56]HBI16651.1 phenylalanine--tRNA ligase subunit beta [Candidatus Moranbacteria bacterium]
MRFSYNWLRELSETKKTPEEIKEDLTLHSFEVEKIEKLGKGLEMVVIGEVLSVTKHPDADKLNVAEVNVEPSPQPSPKGRGGILQIVCGAPNLKEGQKVPVALVGAVLPGDFKIKEAEIRGIKSSGMICAQDELEIGEDHAGIIVLPEDAPVGEKFAQYMDLNDSILEIDVLPNRAHDALSYEGVAREIALLEERTILNENKKLTEEFKIDNQLKIFIETEKCSRYIGAKISGIEISDSPQWLKNRLIASEIKPINNIVDITNYIMLQTGQPLHAFDASGIDEIKIRMAEGGEKLVILNGEEVSLRDSDIVITDGKNPIALAGVMGGLESGVNEKTREIILESANFDAVTIRKTKSSHNIQSDAAYRYERDIDVNFTERAMIEALTLILEITGGKIESISDNYPQEVMPWEIKLELEKIGKLLGVEIEKNKVINILNNLGIIAAEIDGFLSCQIPTRRIDLKNQEDLIEEIGRVFGYTNISTKPLKEKVQVPQKNEERELEKKLKIIMTHSGFNEIKGYSFYSKKDAKALGLNDENHATLLNPMNPDQELIRRTLISGLLRAGKKNLSYYDSINIFDMGKTYIPTDSSLPKEDLLLSALVIEKGEQGEQFFMLKGVLENLFSKIKIFDVEFSAEFDENKEVVVSLHPSRKAIIRNGKGEKLGIIGEITKGVHKYFGIKKMRACVFELSVKSLLAEISRERIYTPLAKFPSVHRDISMVVDKKTLTSQIERAIKNYGGELLKEVSLFDTFLNPETQERSMAFHLTFANSERTLTAQEVDEKITEIMANLEKERGVVMKK